MGVDQKPSIVFLGAGPVALASLKSLSQNFHIEAVISKPNPRSSRAPRHVPAWAEDNGFTLFQPANKHELDDLIQSKNFASRVGVVVDFGMIIKTPSINAFELGIINSHFSLLPQWRGADPITFSLLSGQKITGVSVMQIVPALDEGDLLGIEEYEIAETETIESLTSNLISLSNKMLANLLPQYINDKIKPYPQTLDPAPTFSRKLTKEDGLIDWTKPAKIVEREIRSYLGWPSSFCDLNSIRVTIIDSTIIDASGPSGTTFKHNKKLAVYCGEQALQINSIKPAGKKAMDGVGFMNGYLKL